MADLGPTLTTERLILRPPQPGDFDAFAEMMADAMVSSSSVVSSPRRWPGARLQGWRAAGP